MRRKSAAKDKGRILCLDRRNGRALFDEEVPLQINNYHFSITGDRQTNTVSLSASNHTFTLQFTDDPVPAGTALSGGDWPIFRAPVMGTATKAVLEAPSVAPSDGSGDDSGDDDDTKRWPLIRRQSARPDPEDSRRCGA